MEKFGFSSHVPFWAHLSETSNMDKTKIIVVEDNIVYCEFVCNLLAREGFRTVQAFHLSTAKKLLLQATENDIIVQFLKGVPPFCIPDRLHFLFSFRYQLLQHD